VAHNKESIQRILARKGLALHRLRHSTPFKGRRNHSEQRQNRSHHQKRSNIQNHQERMWLLPNIPQQHGQIKQLFCSHRRFDHSIQMVRTALSNPLPIHSRRAHKTHRGKVTKSKQQNLCWSSIFPCFFCMFLFSWHFPYNGSAVSCQWPMSRNFLGRIFFSNGIPFVARS
jgi:hypothetical protein